MSVVLVQRSSLHVVELANETVVVDEISGSTHLLNTAGSAVWDCLDGARTIGDVIATLSAASAADPADISRDVVAFIEQLSQAGLVTSPAGRAAGARR